jgi:hypothetical protein
MGRLTFVSSGLSVGLAVVSLLGAFGLAHALCGCGFLRTLPRPSGGWFATVSWCRRWLLAVDVRTTQFAESGFGHRVCS